MTMMMITQLQRLRTAIAGVVLFLAEVLRNPTTSPYMENCSAVDFDKSNRYYITITLWYVTNNLQGFDWHRLGIAEALTPIGMEAGNYDLEQWQKHAYFPDDDKISTTHNREKIALLQWYHYGSILGLCQNGMLPREWEKQHHLNYKVYQHRSTAFLRSAAKLSSKIPYSASDEILDRLAFLGHELGLEDINSVGSTVASLSMQRVKKREFTRTLNPGQLKPDDNGWFDGPWEVHALCHHSRLMVLSLEPDKTEDWRTIEQKAEEVKSFKTKLFHFLNSEGLLVPCWERSHIRARKGWVHSEASAVLASTLLDLYPKVSDCNMSTLDAPTTNDPSATVSIEGPKKIVQEMVYMEDLMAQQTRTLARIMPETGTHPLIEWAETWKLPRQYHPENFIASLEDTPQKYRCPYIDKITIPFPLRNFLQDQQTISQGFTKESLEKLSSNERQQVFIADIIDNLKHALVTFSKIDDQKVITKVEDGKYVSRIEHKKEGLIGKLYDSVRNSLSDAL